MLPRIASWAVIERRWNDLLSSCATQTVDLARFSGAGECESVDSLEWYLKIANVQPVDMAEPDHEAPLMIGLKGMLLRTPASP